MFTKPRVLIGAPCHKVPVYDKFYDAFYGLQVPDDESKNMRAISSGLVPENLNSLVQQAIDGKFTHVFIVEDDSTFAPDTLLRLLAHDKPVVTGLCRSRGTPFLPYIYSGISEDGKLAYRPLRPTDKGLIGPAEGVKATGMGGILINTEVFKKLTRPYFWIEYKGEQPWGQDILFGRSLIEAGIEVYCDLDVIIYHQTNCIIGSQQTEIGEWLTTFTIDKATLASHTA